jgi:hypothetical protein
MQMAKRKSKKAAVKSESKSAASKCKNCIKLAAELEFAEDQCDCGEAVAEEMQAQRDYARERLQIMTIARDELLAETNRLRENVRDLSQAITMHIQDRNAMANQVAALSEENNELEKIYLAAKDTMRAEIKRLSTENGAQQLDILNQQAELVKVRRQGNAYRKSFCILLALVGLALIALGVFL